MDDFSHLDDFGGPFKKTVSLIQEWISSKVKERFEKNIELKYSFKFEKIPSGG